MFEYVTVYCIFGMTIADFDAIGSPLALAVVKYLFRVQLEKTGPACVSTVSCIYTTVVSCVSNTIVIV